MAKWSASLAPGWRRASLKSGRPSGSWSACRTLPRLPVIDQPAGELIDQVVTRLRCVKQDDAAIGARVLLIERGDEGFTEEVREEDSLGYRIETKAKASVVEQSIWQQPFATRELVYRYRNRAFVNCPV